jgi:hypothetical protein
LERFTGIIDQWLSDDRERPRKQRHTAKRIFERLRDEHGFEGGYPAATAEAWVPSRQIALRSPAGQRTGTFMPSRSLALCPGRSSMTTTDAFLSGMQASPAGQGVAKIEPDGTRKRARLFSEMLSHYVLRDRYGRPGKGNDKGGVEGLVGYARRNFMVPIPEFPTWEAFNDWLEEQCRKRQADKLRGHSETIGERLRPDLEAMAPLPATPFEACDQASGRVSSLALVRYKTNDYSVPVAYGHRDVWIRAYVDRVVIGSGGEIIARHLRSYDREDMVFDPVHYLPLIEKKIGAFEQAAPLAGWELPKAFATLQRLMEARLLKAGRREYVQVLRLLENFEMEEVHAAVRTAL